MKRGWLIAIFMMPALGAVFAYPGLGKLSTDQLAIVGIFETYCKTQNAADSDGWIALWDVDGVKMAPGIPTIYGRPAIFERVKANFAAFINRKMTVDLREVVVMGDYAFADGTYMVTSTNKATGAPSATDGKFTTILRRQPDGTWLIYRDVTNTNN